MCPHKCAVDARLVLPRVNLQRREASRLLKIQMKEEI
jgi:hypothetical protein